MAPGAAPGYASLTLQQISRTPRMAVPDEHDEFSVAEAHETIGDTRKQRFRRLGIAGVLVVGLMLAVCAIAPRTSRDAQRANASEATQFMAADVCLQYEGIHHGIFPACCKASCGKYCGHHDCHLGVGGYKACCGSKFVKNNWCSDTVHAPCFLPTTTTTTTTTTLTTTTTTLTTTTTTVHLTYAGEVVLYTSHPAKLVDPTLNSVVHVKQALQKTFGAEPAKVTVQSPVLVSSGGQWGNTGGVVNGQGIVTAAYTMEADAKVAAAIKAMKANAPAVLGALKAELNSAYRAQPALGKARWGLAEAPIERVTMTSTASK